MVFNFCIHAYSCIMVWWWPAFRVETWCHVIKLLAKCVLVVTENIDRYCKFYEFDVQMTVHRDLFL